MKKLNNISFIVILTLLISGSSSIASFYFSNKYSQLVSKQENSQLQVKISKINDINHLKKIAISSDIFIIEDTRSHSETYRDFAYLLSTISVLLVACLIFLVKNNIKGGGDN